MQITEFFDSDFADYAVYDVYRSVASYIDGFKPSARKIIHTIAINNIKTPIKVSQLASKTAEATQFLHGEGSLCGVTVGLAQNFAGINNVNLLEPKGSFGNRTVQSAAASRYIFTCKTADFDKYLSKDDTAILIEQEFEGEKIEPRFFVPILPLILVNGSEGIGNGFAQKILPRNPIELKKFILEYLKNGKLPKRITPWFRGYDGTVEFCLEQKNWIIKGKIEKIDGNTLKITEVPIGYDLDKLKKILNRMDEQGKIKTYEDNSVGNKFDVIVKISREWAALPNEELLQKFGLVRRISENFTCLNENNKVVEFKNEVEILKAFVDFRLTYYQKRKDHIITKLTKEIEYLSSRAAFIKGVIDERIFIARRKKAEVENQLERMSFMKVDNSFDYLVGMSIYWLTIEKYDELLKNKDMKINEKTEIEKETPATIWHQDLKNI